MLPEHIERIKDLLAHPESVVIITHRNPDGDAVGSSLGLYNFLKKKGHAATVIVPNDYPRFLKWMPGSDKVVDFEKDKDLARRLVAGAELIFCLDFNALSRIGELGDEVKNAKGIKFLIDHHQMPEDFADYKFVFPDSCSTAQLIYEFIELTGDKELVDAESGICLYTGIMTDTASFRFPSVTAETHRIAAELIQVGVPHYKAHENVYDSSSFNRLRLLGYALGEKMQVLKDLNTAFIALGSEEMARFHHQTGDTEGLVNYCLSIEGIRLAAFFMEREGTIRISFRSKGKFDVNALARAHFSGGGHINAAGGNCNGISLGEAVAKFKEVLERYRLELTK